MKGSRKEEERKGMSTYDSKNWPQPCPSPNRPSAAAGRYSIWGRVGGSSVQPTAVREAPPTFPAQPMTGNPISSRTPPSLPIQQGVTKRRRLSWLTNSAIVYEPKCGVGGGGGSCRVSVNEYSCTQESPNKLWRSNSIFNLCETTSVM